MSRLDRAQWCVVVEDVDAAAKRPDDQIVFTLLNIQVANCNRRQTTFQLNPLLPAINGKEETELGSDKQQDWDSHDLQQSPKPDRSPAGCY